VDLLADSLIPSCGPSFREAYCRRDANEGATATARTITRQEMGGFLSVIRLRVRASPRESLSYGMGGALAGDSHVRIGQKSLDRGDVPGLGRAWGGVKALRRVWDDESDQWLSSLSIKPSQGLIDVQDGAM